MKKFITTSLTAIFLLAGCQEEPSDNGIGTGNYYASVEEFSSDTKTTLGEGNRVVWSDEDRIAIFEGHDEGQAYQILDSYIGKSTGEFSIIEGVTTEGGSGSAFDKTIAVYPYNDELAVSYNENGYIISGVIFPQDQQYTSCSFADEAFPMVASTSKGAKDLSFKNIGGGIKLSFIGDLSIHQIDITSNSDEPLSGKADVAIGSDGLPSINMSDNSSSSVSLTCDPAVQINKDTPTEFVIALPPVNLSNGFTATVTDTEGQLYTMSSNKTNTVFRSSLLKMPLIELGDITEGEIGEFEMPEYIVVDLNSKFDRYDEAIFKDEEHFIFIDYYDNGLVREYCFVSEQDTLDVFYSENGFPKYITDGNDHIIIADYSYNSARVGYIYKNGEYEIHDIETSVNWIEYKELFENGMAIPTKGDLLEKELNLAASTGVFSIMEAILNKIANKPAFSIKTLKSFGGYALAYAFLPSCLEWFLDTISFVDTTFELFLRTKAAYVAHPYITLTVGNILVWGYDGYLIYEGIKNGDFQDFKLLLGKEPELFIKEMEGGWWFRGASYATIDWQGQSINALISLGLANFDTSIPGSFEIGVRPDAILPDGWTARVDGNGRDYTLIVSAKQNNTDETIVCTIPVYMTGVYNIKDDLVFEVTQTPQIQVNPEAVYFTEMSSTTVTVTSYSYETWEVAECPEWLDYKVDKIATQAINHLTLTPNRLENATEGNVVLSVTSGNGLGHYNKCIPVFPYDEEEAALIRDRLMRFYYETGGPTNWYNRTNWCSDKPLEEWYGVMKTDKGWELHLSHNGLIGDGDLSGWTSLVYMDCSSNTGIYYSGTHNHLKSLNLSGCTSLEQLYCEFNDIESLEVSGCPNLKNISFSINKIKNMPDFSGCDLLTNIVCRENLIENISLNSLPMLEYLNCDDNPIESLSIDKCEKLFNISCKGSSNNGTNKLKTLYICNCSSLIGIDYTSQPLESLTIRNCAAIDDPLYWGVSQELKSLDLSNCNALTTLPMYGLSYKNLESINVSGCNSLTELRCNNNKLTSLNVSGCTSLTMLDCQSNYLTSLDVSGCQSLTILDCQSNQLTSLDVSGCTKLHSLKCNNNHITQQITIEDRIATFNYDILYEYWEEWNEATQQYIIKYSRNPYGWYYQGEPSRGYHVR